MSGGPTTSQYYFVLQSLHKLLPSTTLYYKACTNCFPVLLCTTKLAQTRYRLDRRPWHEMGFSAKNSRFFDVPHFALFQTTAKQHFVAFFFIVSKVVSALLSKKAMGVIGPRLCLKTHWFTIALTSSDIRVCPATLELAFTCCGHQGHQSFFSERHALSIIWVPAREGPYFFFSTI